MRRGFFIAFEGITGSGKKTHIKMLAGELQREKIEFTTISFPNFETEIARLTRRLQLDPYTQSLLYAADRAFNQDRIKSLLGRGQVVITDRYCYSNFAYQSAKGVPLEWLMEIEKNTVKPDVVFLIDVPTETTVARVQQSSIEDFTKKEIIDRIQRERDILEKTRQNFLELARTDKRAKWFVIDGTKEIPEVHEEIWAIVKAEIEKLKE
jgi:dTMP kinase